MDASGKNTQTRLLAERLIKAELKVHCYSFPRYETPLGQVILRHLKSEVSMTDKGGSTVHEDALVFQCMMTADKYAVADVISAAQNRDEIVIADRWTQSAICYGSSDGLPTEWLTRVQAWLPKPDLNILLDLPFEKSWQRRPERRDRYEKNADKLQEIQSLYRNMWLREMETDASWVIVDAEPPMEVVAKSVLDAVLRTLARMPFLLHGT
jgi:dTMP kinase